jgi:dihydrolipoamide dehydrogenase
MKYDIIIIGSGPAGYTAAIRASQLGMRTALIEKHEIGGICLNWGCVPVKSLIESAKLFQKIQNDAAEMGIDGIKMNSLRFNFEKADSRASSLVNLLTDDISSVLKKNAVDIIIGEAKIRKDKSVSVNNRTLEANHILLATGTRIPAVQTKKIKLLQIFQILKQKKIDDNIVVYGNNSTAVELAQFFALIGKNVHIITEENHIMPLADRYLAKYMQKILKMNGIGLHTNLNLKNWDSKYSNGKIRVKDIEIPCDVIVNAQSRKAVLPEMELKVEMTEDGFISTDENCHTSVEGLFAIGDVNGKSSFAHIASAQAMHLVNHIKGVGTELRIKDYPMNMYSVPEIAQIGYTEQDLKSMKVDYSLSQYSLKSNAKAMAEGNTEGFIRILSEKKYGEVLGVQIAAANATDMIAEASAFMQIEASVYDVAKTVHAHPSIAEIFIDASKQAIENLDGE